MSRARFVWDKENGPCGSLDFEANNCLTDAKDTWEEMERPRCWLFADIAAAPWSYYVAAEPPKRKKT